MSETEEKVNPPPLTENKEVETKSEEKDANANDVATIPSEKSGNDSKEAEQEEKKEEVIPVESVSLPSPEKEQTKSKKPAPFEPTRLHSKKPYPILKGYYVNDGNMCVWSGLWGMGSNGEVHGVTSDFRYQMKLTEGLSAEGPQDGNYNGYFWMKVVPPKRVNANGLHLREELPSAGCILEEAKTEAETEAASSFSFGRTLVLATDTHSLDACITSNVPPSHIHHSPRALPRDESLLQVSAAPNEP